MRNPKLQNRNGSLLALSLLVLGACKQDYSLSLLSAPDPVASETPTGNGGSDPSNNDQTNPSDPANGGIVNQPPGGGGGGTMPNSGLELRSQEFNVQTVAQDNSILFVIDNSGSMGEEIARVRSSITGFFQTFVNEARNFSVGVISTDFDGTVGTSFANANAYTNFLSAGPGGLLASLSNPEPRTRWVDSRTTNPAQAMAQISNNLNLPTNGSGSETALMALQAAASASMIAANGWNKDFFGSRVGRLNVIIVSDEDDSAMKSRDPLAVAAGLTANNLYSRRVKGFADARVQKTLSDLRGLRDPLRSDLVKVHVVGGKKDSPDLNGCPLNRDTNEASGLLGTADTYFELAKATRGAEIDLCQIRNGVRGDFAAELEVLGNDIAVEVSREFGLAEVPHTAESIRVWLEDNELEQGNATNGFTYDAAMNKVTIHGNLSQFVEFNVKIEYQVAIP